MIAPRHCNREGLMHSFACCNKFHLLQVCAVIAFMLVWNCFENCFLHCQSSHLCILYHFLCIAYFEMSIIPPKHSFVFFIHCLTGPSLSDVNHSLLRSIDTSLLFLCHGLQPQWTPWLWPAFLPQSPSFLHAEALHGDIVSFLLAMSPWPLNSYSVGTSATS